MTCPLYGYDVVRALQTKTFFKVRAHTAQPNQLTMIPNCMASTA
jgi:hypothetical protein